jgi:hypothetical protein
VGSAAAFTIVIIYSIVAASGAGATFDKPLPFTIISLSTISFSSLIEEMVILLVMIKFYFMSNVMCKELPLGVKIHHKSVVWASMT